MKGFAPGLLERLMGEHGQGGAGVPRLSVEQLKDSIARDLEALLNTRVAIAPHQFDEFPHARASIINYGLPDFAGMCLTSSEDREAICASLKVAIETHEPRLTEVSAGLEADDGGVNRLRFVITARLLLYPSAEPVNFNAVLQPSSLRYSIAKTQRQRGQADT
jgi:type VI secretion system protein ImpF